MENYQEIPNLYSKNTKTFSTSPSYRVILTD